MSTTPETITTPEGLDALPLDAYWSCGCGYRGVKIGADDYRLTSGRLLSRREVADGHLPLTVLWPRPDAPTSPAEGREALARLIAPEVWWDADADALSLGGVQEARRRALARADVALAWFAARQSAPVASAAQVSALADALRAEVHEHGSDGATFEAVIRAWLGGDYDGPAPVDAETCPVDAETCSFCGETRDDLSIGSDGTTTACADCLSVGEVSRG